MWNRRREIRGIKDIESHVGFENRLNELMAHCEAELLQNYNRKDKYWIYNKATKRNRKVYYQKTAPAVLNLLKEIAL